MKPVIFLLLSLMVSSVGARECNSLESLAWLEGTWLSKSKKSQVTESWRSVSAETFEGKGVFTNVEKNTVSSEALRLMVMNDAVFYLAKVNHNQLPIAFKAVACSETGMRLVNEKHDFPNNLTYKLRGNKNLSVKVADLEGNGFTLNFTKVPDAK